MQYYSAMTLGIAYRLGESRLESLYYLKKKNYYDSFKSKRAQSPSPLLVQLLAIYHFVFVKLQ